MILALAITILGHSSSHFTLSSFDPAKSLHGRFSDLTLGMVFTAVIFGGFEAAAVLGEESRDPRRIIPRGIFGSLALVGAFYLIVSFAETQGVGFAGMQKFATSTSQLQDLTSRSGPRACCGSSTSWSREHWPSRSPCSMQGCGTCSR